MRVGIKYMAMGVALLVLVGCGEGGNDGTTGRMSRMSFRPERAGEGLLGASHRGPDGTWSINPPKGWVFGRAPSGAESSLEVRANPTPGKYPTLAGLDAERKVLDVSLRKTGATGFVGTDLYVFRDFFVLQSLVRRGDRAVLKLKIYTQSGRSIELTYRLRADSYQKEARAIEASIASVDFRD